MEQDYLRDTPNHEQISWIVHLWYLFGGGGGDIQVWQWFFSDERTLCKTKKKRSFSYLSDADERASWIACRMNEHSLTFTEKLFQVTNQGNLSNVHKMKVFPRLLNCFPLNWILWIKLHWSRVYHSSHERQLVWIFPALNKVELVCVIEQRIVLFGCQRVTEHFVSFCGATVVLSRWPQNSNGNLENSLWYLFMRT